MENVDIKVEKENREYADILLEDYAGSLGVLSSLLTYTYQMVIQGVMNRVLAEDILSIKNRKMEHMEIIGKLILLLGGNPQFGTMDSRIRSRMIPYTTCGICYEQNPVQFLEQDIKKEKQIYQQYIAHQKIVKDVYIQDIFTMLLEEEKELIATLQKLLEAAKSAH